MNKTVSVQLFLMFMLIVFGHNAIAATPEVAPRGDSAPFGSPDEIRRMATTGNREAMYLMGQMYESGFGVEQNTLEAFTWFKQAADAGLGVVKLGVEGARAAEQAGVELGLGNIEAQAGADRFGEDHGGVFAGCVGCWCVYWPPAARMA